MADLNIKLKDGGNYLFPQTKVNNIIGIDNYWMNHIQMSAMTFSNRGCSTFTTDSTTGITTCVAPAGSSTWGYGVTFTNSVSFNPGETLIIALDVRPSVNCSCMADINNATSDGKNPGGNDNDDGAKRNHNSYNLTANIWQTVWFTQTAYYNADYYLKNASSNWGIVTSTSDISFDIRNVRYGVISILNT